MPWSEYFKEIVQVTDKRSFCDRLQVGCLLIKDNHIVSQGYNVFLPSCKHISIVRDEHEQATAHTEQNAISDCAKRVVKDVPYILHITLVLFVVGFFWRQALKNKIY